MKAKGKRFAARFSRGFKMEENKKKRIRLSDDSKLVWQQRHADDKNVHANIVRNDNVLYRNAQAAKAAEDRMYAERLNRERESRETPAAEKQRREDLRRIEEKLEVRNTIMRQEHRLGMDGLLSYEDITRAQESNKYVGTNKPLNIKKRDVRGLTGKTKRKRSSKRLLPSERRQRLSRARIERGRKKELEKTARRELYVKDANGNKISIDRLRKLRGLDKNRAVTKRDAQVVQKQISKEAGRGNALRIRKRDEYTR